MAAIVGLCWQAITLSVCVCLCVTSDPSYLADCVWDYIPDEERGQSPGLRTNTVLPAGTAHLFWHQYFSFFVMYSLFIVKKKKNMTT